MKTIQSNQPKSLYRRASLLLFFIGPMACGNSQREKTFVSPEDVADYVHMVIEADRANYAEKVVHRLQDVDKVIHASEHFEEDKALPLPSQMLRMGAQAVSKKGLFRYALISKWAINKANLPKTDFESKGLDAVAKSPESPYRSYETAGDKRYYMALYADKAVSQACVLCHNSHERSPRHDFKQGDVMGGIVVALPVGPS